jgi:hypothetical protein
MEIGNMKLTEKETVLVERLLNCYEKKTASWARKRWVLLGLAIIGICASAYVAISAFADLRSQASYDIVEVIESDKSLTQENAHLWAVGMMVKIAKIFELRQEMLVLIYLEATSGFLIGVFSICLLVIIIRRWNMDERDALICKVLRAKWQDEVSKNQDKK